MKKKGKKPSRLPKILKIVGAIVALYVLLFYLLIGPLFWAVTYPNTSKAKYYEPLVNWNLPVYGIGDFDGDGKTDAVFSQGCALLTARDEAQITADKQCGYSMWGRLSDGLPQDRTIAEKYLPFKEFEISWKTAPTHSYMFKQDDNSNWNIVAFSKGRLTQHEIGQNGMLHEKSPSVHVWLNEIIYVPGHILSMIIIDPVILLGWVLFGHVPIVLSVLAAWTILLLIYLSFRKKILGYFSKNNIY